MSKTYEFDGDIEENNDDDNGGNSSGDNNGQTPNSSDANKEESSEEPWYNKYLDEEEDNSSEQDNEEDSSSEEDNVKEEIPNSNTESSDEDLNHSEEESEIPAPQEVSSIRFEIENISDVEEKKPSAPKKKVKKKAQEAKPKSKKGEESFDDIFPPSNRPPIANMTWLFFSLFIACFMLLCYYQFYDGKKVKITFRHQSHQGIGRLDSITDVYSYKVQELQDQQEIIAQLREKIQALHERNFELANDTSQRIETATPIETIPQLPKGADLNKGTYYQIQVIALKNYHPEITQSSDLNMYVDSDQGFTKLLLGAVDNEKEAKRFYQEIKKAGFEDAFIVKKVNGSRVEYRAFD